MPQSIAPPAKPLFGDRLRKLRKLRGFRTAKSFAERLGVDQNTYTRYERGEAEPSLDVLERIWRVLSLPANDLIGPVPTTVSGFAEAGDGVAGYRASLVDPDGLQLWAWRVAEAFTAATSPPGASGIGSLKQKTSVYERLLADPFGEIAELVRSADLAAAAPALQADFSDRVAGFTRAVGGPPRKV